MTGMSLLKQKEIEEATDTADSLCWVLLVIQKKLMKGGNYGKELINFDKIVKVLQAVQVAQDRQNAIKTALEIYNGFRKLWRATYPEKNLSQRT